MVKSNCRTTKKTNSRKGLWSPEEDQKLIAYVNKYGIWNWAVTPTAAGLLRCGKSCRLRWMNYLRPGIKHGNFSQEEDKTVINLHQQLGNRWSTIASKLPGRTDNEIKNHWHTHLKKNVHLQGNQTVNQENSSESDDSSNCNGSTPWMSSQPSFDNFSSSSSCDSSGEIYNYNNQITIEEKNGSSVSSNGEVRSLWNSTPFPTMKGLFMVDDSAPLSFDDFCSSSSCGPAADQNTYGELQRLWDPPFPMQGLHIVDDHGATYKDPGLLVSTSQSGFQENTYTFASCDDANEGLWASLLEELNEERV